MFEFFKDKAPVEVYSIKGRLIYIRRDDLTINPPLPPNAKMTALYNIVRHAYILGYKEVVLFAKKQQGTPYIVGLPPICKQFKMSCIVTYPLAKTQQPPNWMFEMLRNNYNVKPVYLHPNMITVNVNQSKKIAETLDAYHIPFGFDHEISVNTHANKFELPQNVGTLVLSTMTGMILAGVLKQIYTRGYDVQKVYGISSGRSPESIYASIAKYIPWNIETSDIQDKTKVIEAFERSFQIDQSNKELYPFPMHPDYEAKAWTWLLDRLEFPGLYEALPDPIWFINSGR